MNNVESKNLGSMLRRALALVLVLSLVVIPVQFPGSAAAVEEALTETYFSDDFTADEEGVVYQWNESFTSTYEKKVDGVKTYPPVVTGQIADGAYQLNVYNTTASITANRLYLSGMQGGVDVTQSWSNYTAEFDLRMDPKTTGHSDYSMMAMVYVDEEGQGYGLRVDTRNEIYMYQVYKNESGVLTAGRCKYLGLQATGQWIHVELTVTNKTYVAGQDPDTGEDILEPANVFSAKVTGFNHTGTLVTASNIIDTATYTGVGIKFIEGGSVGMYVSSYYLNASGTDSSYLKEFNHAFDNVLVTGGEGETLFSDDFSDNRYKEGSTASWNDVSYESGEFRFKEVSFTSDMYNNFATTGGSVVDGVYTFYSNSIRSNSGYMSVVQRKNADGEYELPQWKDFTVDVEVTYGDANSGAAIYGRVSYDSESGKYSYYVVTVTGSYVYIYKCVDGTITNVLGRQSIGSSKTVSVSFTTLEDGSTKIFVLRGDRNCEYTDSSSLAAGSVGVGYYVELSNMGDYWAAFEYLNVTDASGEVLLSEEFESTTGIVQTGMTPDYRWNQVENDAATANVATNKWWGNNSTTSAYAVHFDNPEAGSVSTFRMDLQMQLGDADVTGYMNDYVLNFANWVGTSGSPGDSLTASYAGVSPVYPLHVGALLRVQPVLDEDGNVVDYTYYRVRVYGGRLYFEKRWYNPSTQQYEDVVIANPRINHYEDVWYAFNISVIGDTITVRRPMYLATRFDVYASYTVSVLGTFVDDGTYGAPYTSGGVSLWAQAENSTAETVDMNVYFDNVKLYTSDMNRVFYDDFESNTYLGETFASGARPYLLFDNYAYTDERAYTSTQTLTKPLDPTVNWNVVQDGENDVLEKTSDANDLRYVAMNYNDDNDAFGWENYGVSAKLNLAEGGYAGILFGYDGVDGYELRFDGAKAAIYKITSNVTAAAPVAEVAQVLEAGAWTTVTLKVLGGALIYTVGANDPVVMAVNGTVLPSAGTVGLDASAGVQFDDVSVYSLGGAPAFNVIDGRIYCNSLSVEVTDDDLVSFTLDGVPVEGNSTYINETGTFTLEAVDAAGHVTTATVTVKNTDHKYEPAVFGIARLNERKQGNYCIYCKNHDGTTAAVTSKSAKYNGTEYNYIQEALNAAYTAYTSTGVEQEVDLLITQIVRGLEIRPGVKLDLNGYHLSAITMENFGQIIDSVGTGGLCITDCEAEEPYLGGNEWLPLLDKTTGYYRFFEKSFVNLGVKEDGEFHKFGMRLTLTDAEAYDLLLANDIEIGFAITWTGLDETLYYVFKDATVEKYVKAVKAKLDASEEVTTAMILKVRELEKINGGYLGEMIVTPILMTDATDIAILGSTTVVANPL